MPICKRCGSEKILITRSTGLCARCEKCELGVITEMNKHDTAFGTELPIGDNIHHPSHYNKHPSGIECIDVVEHMPFNVGNAVKYLWRAGLKGDAIEDLQKASWYISREISKRQREV